MCLGQISPGTAKCTAVNFEQRTGIKKGGFQVLHSRVQKQLKQQVNSYKINSTKSQGAQTVQNKPEKIFGAKTWLAGAVLELLCLKTRISAK